MGVSDGEAGSDINERTIHSSMLPGIYLFKVRGAISPPCLVRTIRISASEQIILYYYLSLSI